MSEADSNEQIDADILQAKADVLQARGIVASHEAIIPDKPIPKDDFEDAIGIEPLPIEDDDLPIEEIDDTDIAGQINSTSGGQSEGEQATLDELNTSEEQAEQTGPGEDVATESKDLENDGFDIPSFDLAEEIMAEQRKITATKRKGPGTKRHVENRRPEDESIDHRVEQSGPAPEQDEKVISDIVARDIEKLCKDNGPLPSPQENEDEDKNTEKRTPLNLSDEFDSDLSDDGEE